jgi:hypothetical protein
MKLSDQEIEKTLRGAPRPKAPADLRPKLVAQVSLAGARNDSRPTAFASGVAGWLRRWWPALAPASVSLACVAAMVSQTVEIRALQQNNRRLAQQRVSLPTAAPMAPAVSAQPEAGAADATTAEQKEIARLKERAEQLAAEIGQLEQVQKENENLRTQLAAPPTGLPKEVTDAQELLSKARERAMANRCVNNLKELGLAARIWAIANGDRYPTEILSMTNELNRPNMLFCPADSSRAPVTNWAAFTAANCSYDYLASGGSVRDQTRVLFRCPIHGSIGLCDGSVQMRVAKEHPESLVERDGKLYWDRNAETAKP